MFEENISQEFRLKNIYKTKNYFFEEIEKNEFMIKKHKKVCTILNYIEHFLILDSIITGCISISVFACLLDIPKGNTSSAIELEICAITAGIKNISQQLGKKKDRDEIVLLAKSKLNSIQVLISKALIYSNISYDEFLLANNVLKECDDVKKEIKDLKA